MDSHGSWVIVASFAAGDYSDMVVQHSVQVKDDEASAQEFVGFLVIQLVFAKASSNWLKKIHPSE